MRSTRAASATVLVLLVSAGCSIQEAEVPPITGPSEFGLSIALTATPDTITQDGQSQAAITAVARDASGQPRPGVTLLFASNLAGATFTEATKTTDANGRATTGLVAPPAPSVASSSGSVATVTVTPVGDDFQNAVSRRIEVRIVPPAGTPLPNNNPVAAFTIVPAVANINQDVTVDASGTTDENEPCGDRCTYQWDWGDFTTGDGRTEEHEYSLPGTYTITLTVVDERGGVSSVQRSLTVNGPAAPVATFVTAPTSPGAGDSVTFNASASTVGAGATITSYTWDFGDSSATETRTTSGIDHPYSAAGTYLVTLTITDSLGRTATRTSSLTVVP